MQLCGTLFLRRYGRIFAGIFLSGWLALSALAADVSIGVLALRGPEKTLETWSATASYLEQQLPGNTFKIVPLGFEEVRLAVRQGRVDFILSNSSYYVELESLYGVSAIATLKNRFIGSTGHSTFGGVIFTRADRKNIRTLADLRKKTFAATDPSSFGGWHVGWRELQRQGLNPQRDFAQFSFAGTHDAVVYAVRDGRADAGTVRTETLELMVAEGKIRLDDYYVLNPQRVAGFPPLLSTPLYPEWPLARLRHVPEALAIRVAIALMQMPADAPAALAGNISGWTLPLNYQPVHEALRELRIGPYEHSHRLTRAEFMSQYGHWIALALAFVLLTSLTTAYVVRINRRLRANHAELAELNATLEDRVHQRTGEVERLLERERFQRNVVEMVADVNQILITSSSLDEMLKACCDRLIAGTAYRFAWVGLLRAGQLEVAAKSYGPSEIMRNFATCRDKGPSCEALASNRTVIARDPAAIAEELIQAGVHAVIALPLRRDAYGEALGHLCVLSGRAEGFDAEEVEMLEQLAGDIGFALHAFNQQTEAHRLERERISNYEETILSLVDMIEKRDTYTAGHTRRVAQYCELIATRLGHSPEEIEKLKRAAALHDIGKIAIPDAVLLKPGILTPLEYELIKQHAEEGYRTLHRIDMYKELAEIMRSHHEREDGSGYPQGLVSGQIPRLAQIMAVADSFDAMVSNRIYKARKEVPVALEELKQQAGTRFAADVVAAACEALRDVVPPPIADQMPKTPLEHQRFAYFFDDPLTGTHNANYLQIMLRNGLPAHLTHAYVVLLRHFSGINQDSGWMAGNQALAGFSAALIAHYPDALVFRVMGDDFVLLSTKPLNIDGDGLKALSPLKGTRVEVEVRALDPQGAGREDLLKLL
ncbi:MAG: PhnD/SsuA/transferrin family substrate-binding protein [Gammaproteobacteria bacterium]|nr:PhnD/SsuA/transferrin family substrate-binding protein [Rhodocyclaceae bacterium]MBU3907620.1 PhnD/SsuA/transferrin family substrate-binding protein [Gammaproteobacteria bacterium]MBU3990892.1 PhnD/SsuA/transferrin family substrate-binding protein [Gammaproteobacteria bacterium]MBU4004266.1 PhnD/SsuA/transferrin family substrate-binding protein [Gammaproteobacteria bacterium]MBU4019675.1 PhnD/SsuA/transferrin family substrate-binding protein [Gammaproteobacteria bacterium]